MGKVSIRDQMAKVFQAAATERNKRQELVPVPGSPGWTEFAWVAFERAQMHTAVNKERATRGLAPVDVQTVMRAEQLAVGHSDYAAKYALYCAELAVGESPWERP